MIFWKIVIWNGRGQMVQDRGTLCVCGSYPAEREVYWSVLFISLTAWPAAEQAVLAIIVK